MCRPGLPAGRVMLQGPAAALISSESNPWRTPRTSPAFRMARSVPATYGRRVRRSALRMRRAQERQHHIEDLEVQ
jgi:hypothetical protein